VAKSASSAQTGVVSGVKRNGVMKTDFHFVAKLFENGLERDFEPEAFLVSDWRSMMMSWMSSAEHALDVDMTR